MQAVLDFIQTSNMLYISTIEGNQPRVRPMSSLELFNGKLFFRTQNTKDVYKQIVANPKIEILYMRGMEWLRITAEAVVEPKGDDRIEMLKGSHEGDPGMEAIYLQNAKAVFYNAHGITRTVEF